MFFDLEEELKKLPASPGVYLMHNNRDEIIYVGKAISLKNRVRQYFQSSRNKTAKIQQMVSHIAWFEYIPGKEHRTDGYDNLNKVSLFLYPLAGYGCRCGFDTVCGSVPDCLLQPRHWYKDQNSGSCHPFSYLLKTEALENLPRSLP